MDEKQRRRARELILAQEQLLVSVATGQREADEADGEYKARHRELRQLLAIDTRPCLCPWGSVMPWAFAFYADWRAELDGLMAPLRDLLIESAAAPWRLVCYRRNRAGDDLPFDAFESSLTDEQWVVLDESLQHELAREGTDLLRNDRKMHTMPCGGGRHPQPSVLMYKIREGTPSSEVVLRIFFDTAPGRTIVLLHGYDKGDDISDRTEAVGARIACGYRHDLLAQLADPGEAIEAVSSVRT